jgi:hypothetical protein
MRPTRFEPDRSLSDLVVTTIDDCPYGSEVLATRSYVCFRTPLIPLDHSSRYNMKVWIRVNDSPPVSEKEEEKSITMPKLPISFYCPLTLELMRDPVIDKEGNSYEREAIVGWLSKNQSSPVTRTTMTANDLAPNRALQESILAIAKDLPSPPPPCINKGYIYVGFSEYDYEKKLVKRGDHGGQCDGTYYYYPISHEELPSDGQFHVFHVRVGPESARLHHPAARFISGIVLVNYRWPLPGGNALYQITDCKFYEDPL